MVCHEDKKLFMSLAFDILMSIRCVAHFYVRNFFDDKES